MSSEPTAAEHRIQHLLAALERCGCRECDIPACNCGSYHNWAEEKARSDEADAQERIRELENIVELQEAEIRNRHHQVEPVAAERNAAWAAVATLRGELESQRELWRLASLQLNVSDDTANRVRFIELHRPRAKLEAALAGTEHLDTARVSAALALAERYDAAYRDACGEDDAAMWEHIEVACHDSLLAYRAAKEKEAPDDAS